MIDSAPHGFIGYYFARRDELRRWAAGDPTATAPGTAVPSPEQLRQSPSGRWSDAHMNLDRSMADVERR